MDPKVKLRRFYDKRQHRVWLAVLEQRQRGTWSHTFMQARRHGAAATPSIKPRGTHYMNSGRTQKNTDDWVITQVVNQSSKLWGFCGPALCVNLLDLQKHSFCVGFSKLLPLHTEAFSRLKICGPALCVSPLDHRNIHFA